MYQKGDLRFSFVPVQVEIDQKDSSIPTPERHPFKYNKLQCSPFHPCQIRMHDFGGGVRIVILMLLISVSCFTDFV